MGFVRGLLLVLLVAGGACFAAYALTAQTRYRTWGVSILKWTLGAAGLFFAVLIAQRASQLW